MIRIALVGCSNARAYESPVARCASAAIGVAVEGGPLDRDGWDAAIIESSLEDRVDLCVQAAAARQHVLVAPPLAPTIEDAERVIEACRVAGVCLMVAQRMRFLPAVATIHRSLTDGRLGRLGLVRMHRWQARGCGGGRRGDAPLETAAQEIDLARWLFGARPTILLAAERELGGGRYVQIHFGFEGGGMALLDHAPALAGTRGYFSLSAIGSNGAAYADDHHDTHLVFRDGDPTTLVPDQEGRSLRGLIEEFAGAISARRAPAITGADGRELLEISLGIRRSLLDGCPVRWEGDGYEPVE